MDNIKEDSVRPRVIVSKCIEFDHCRYNGDVISSEVVRALKKFVDFVPVCPEVEIGLGVPRDPIRIVAVGRQQRLIQPSTGKDVSHKMKEFAERFLGSPWAVDGFILKSRSPSCGFKDAKVFPSVEKQAPVARSAGFFAAAVLERFPGYPVEDESRLTNFRIREHFFSSLWALSRFREARATGKISALVDYHSRNKFLLMAYNQAALRRMGRIVANKERLDAREVFAAYERDLRAAFSKPPKYASNVNVLMHALGYFTDKITVQERKYFLRLLDRYREGKLPLSAAVAVAATNIARFEERYLALQTYFDPYPEALVEITDSGKGRDL